MEIKAAVVNSIGEDYQLEDLVLAEMQPDEVLVKMVASGMCMSDETLKNGGGTVPFPNVLGHEGSGIIEKVGNVVKGFKPGDQVVLSYAYCGSCPNCRTGRPAACDDWGKLNGIGVREDGSYTFHKEDGTPVNNLYGHSSFTTHSLVHESNLIKVDQDVDLRLIGPLGCGFLTGSGTVVNGLKPESGSSIAVFGTGAVGLAAMMAAKIEGCSTIIAVDIHDSRLEVAKNLGATHIINSKNEDPIEKIKEITNGIGVKYSVDTTGVPPVMNTALTVLATGGVMAPVAISGKSIELNPTTDLILVNKSIIGVLMGDGIPQLSIPQLVKFYKEGRFPFDELVKFYNFKDINQAAKDSISGEVIKPILIMDETYKPLESR
ncbi:NAD(P)-dependent alcohol dehydrogenase [Priestia taiwanensis]|uniref:Aryl-alcohol dehydrogenase n=1 Tax=Priestia taiwanensis TaxID=1347902 RepID=A0A917AM52_9BACI|nr:NAD(P)-dependent alcohol dehydrogenase [Priestia taiwanensis]MBM7362358.1 aryl-alcohol dehydrogenase [Priestia taiwanensis]GGE61518.1 aryl-alcohol dehydrogenase [Priestia taiwanensis]